MHLMGRLGDMDGEAIVDWVMKCRHSCGGFGGSEVGRCTSRMQLTHIV
jgi:geranylgeranyl transferase type-2 subunit beta